MPALLIYHRDGADVVELCPGVALVVGRAPPSQVQIADDSLSREHARFVLEKGAVMVEDLGSRNGTWVHGERATRAMVYVGDELVLGRVLIWLCERETGDDIASGLISHERFRGRSRRRSRAPGSSGAAWRSSWCVRGGARAPT